MASETEAQECMPCRGTGKVISNLGGTPSTVVCPWCKGSGTRLSGVDAQASWLGGEDESGGEPGSPDPDGGDVSPHAPDGADESPTDPPSDTAA